MELSELKAVLEALADVRPIFHSEADFQHALAWQLKSRFADALIRLEVPFRQPVLRPEYVDLLVHHGGKRLAIELKYKTRGFNTQIDSEVFELQNHSAHDLGRYDFLADVQRLERFVNDKRADNGVAILLTNDRAYWSAPSRDGTIDEHFRLTEGKHVTGLMQWLGHASEGTIRGRRDPIDLKGAYQCTWRSFSPPREIPGASFRYLIWQV